MTEPLLEARGISKRYGNVLALDGADFTVRPGEVVALIGDNGAGKSTLVKTLSGGQQQSVAVARVVSYASKVIFMDEPTAALGVRQRARVLDTIRRVRDRGIAIVLISHNMPEVLAVSDRIEVLRMGRRVAVYTAEGTSVEQLVGAMTGALAMHDGDAEGGSHER